MQTLMPSGHETNWYIPVGHLYSADSQIVWELTTRGHFNEYINVAYASYLIDQELPQKQLYYKTITAENCCKQCSSYLNICYLSSAAHQLLNFEHPYNKIILI